MILFEIKLKFTTITNTSLYDTLANQAAQNWLEKFTPEEKNCNISVSSLAESEN